MNMNKISANAIISAAASLAQTYTVAFNSFKGINHFPAPRRIKSIVSIYNSRRDGTLKSYNYTHEKGEPRPAWTYRAARRNVTKLGRYPLTKAA